MRQGLPYLPMDAGEARLAHAPGVAEVGDLWRILWCRRAWIGGTMAVCLAAALIYTVLVPPQYAATAQLLIDPRARQVVTKDVNPDVLAPDGGVIQVESQTRVIESDTVLLRAVAAAGLDRDTDYGARKETFVAILLDAAKGLFGDSDVTGPAAAQNRALAVLRKHLSVKRADKVFVVDVTVTAASGAKAARIADAIAEAYLADQNEARAESSRRAGDALTSRLMELRDGVRDAENRAERYKAEHDIVGTNKELVSDMQLGESTTKLSDARAKSGEQRARLDQIEAFRRRSADSGALPEALQSTVVTQLRASYQEQVRRVVDLRTRVGERHPDLIAATAQAVETKREIDAELARLALSARADYDRALANERALSAGMESSKVKTLSAGRAAVELNELNREIEARRSVYQAFLARAGEAKAQSGVDTSNARIISKAIPPDQPSWPTRGFILLSAIGGGLGLGAGVALILEYAAPTILSLNQLQRVVPAPAIQAGTAQRSDDTILRPRRGTDAKSGKDPIDQALALALTRLCGPLGTLRTAARPYSLLITAGPQDGGAGPDVADRLVAVAAERGIAVLLVEADLGKSGHGGNGFLDVLRSDCALRASTVPQGAAGVERLGVGHPQRRGNDDLQDETIERFLYKAGRYFDLVVFDGGVFEQNLALAPLAAAVDDVLLIVVQGVTRERAAAATADAIAAAANRPVSASLLLASAA